MIPAKKLSCNDEHDGVVKLIAASFVAPACLDFW